MGDRYIGVDEKRANKAQRLYDAALDKYLVVMDRILSNYSEIEEILDGNAMGLEGEKYNITKERRAALKERSGKLEAFMKNPDSTLSHIHQKLKRKAMSLDIGGDVKIEKSSQSPQVADIAEFRID